MWFFSEATDVELTSADKALDFSSSIPAPFSIIRTAAALGRDNSGRWISFPANTARSWYDPITLETPYTLIEPERTQLLYRTRQPTLTAVQSTSSVDQTIQTPFGTGAVLYVPNTTSATHGWNLFFGTSTHGAVLPDNTTVSLSAVLRPSGIYTNITFFLLNRTGIYSSVQVALEGNGSIVSSTGVISARVRRDTDGFYAVEMVNNYGTGTTTPSFNSGFHDQTGTRTFVGNGVSGFYLAYIGAEIGTEATSPIVNAGTTVLTRPADIVSSTPEWLESGPKTLGLTYVPLGRSQSTILNIAGADQISLRNGTGDVSLSATVNGQQVATITTSAPQIGIERTVVTTMTPASVVLAQNGAVVGNDNTGTMIPNFFSSIRIGDAVTGGSGGPMLMKLFKYWAESLPQDASVSYSSDLTQEFETQDKISITIQPTITILPTSNAVSLLVRLSGEPVGSTVSYNTVDETALSGTDYVGISGTLAIPVGATSAVITVGLMPRGDVQDKTFKIVLSSATGATIINGTCLVLLMKKIPEGAPASTKVVFGGTLPVEMSLTRASPAWTRNSTGVWAQVASNGYRQHYVGPNLSGMLIEPAQAEQHLFDSVDPSFAATGGTRTIVTSETTPTGTRQIQFRENTSASQHKLALTIEPGVGVTPTGAFAVTVLIRPVVRKNFVVFLRGIDNIPRLVVVDLSGIGVATSVPAGLTSLVERDAFRTDWYSISVGQPQSVNNGVPVVVEVQCSLPDGTTSFTGVSGSGFDLCHVQVEPGMLGSSPIIVTGASDKTVRAADILRAAGTWYQRQTYSLGARFRRLKDVPAIQRLWMAKDISNQAMGVLIKSGEITYDVVGEVPLVTFQATGTGTQTTWTLPDSGTDGASYTVIVSLDGLLQSSDGYTLANNVLTLSGPAPLNTVVEVRGLPSAGTLLETTANGNQTVWTLPGNSATGTPSLLVAVDGVIQPISSYTVLPDQLTFSQAPPVGSSISVRRIGTNILWQEFSATGTATPLAMGQSAAAGSASLLVIIDGLLQTVDSYTTAGAQLTFSQTVPANARIDIRFLSR